MRRLCLALLSLVIGCGQGPTATQKAPRPQVLTALDFHYPLNIPQSPTNHHSIIILDPHVQVSDNLKPYAQRFQDALISQIQEIFERRGYSVLRLHNKESLTPAQKRGAGAALDVSGWVGVLEDVKMDTDDPKKADLNAMVEQSSGAVWFHFFEPESGRVIHNFAFDVGAYQAINHNHAYRATNAAGFFSPDIVSYDQKDPNEDDAIRKILNEIYAGLMDKLLQELTEANVNRYKKALEQIKPPSH